MSEKVYFNAEQFNLKHEALDDGSEGIILEGVAMPLGKMSRNKVFYRPESVKKAYKTMKGAAFLFNHNSDVPIGHVEDASLEKDNMMYRANMDPEETKFVNKVKRKDIRHVSIGCLVENVEFNEDGSVNCDIAEFVELSLVPVPGFSDASAQVTNCLEASPLLLAEKFGNEEMVEKLKKEAEDPKDDKDEADDEDDKEKESDGETDDDKKDKMDDEDDKEKEKCKDKEADDEDDKKDEADDEDDKKDEADDEDDDKEKESEDPEDKDKDEADDEDDKKEGLEAQDDEGEQTTEEILKQVSSKVEEIQSTIEEVNNRVAITESKVEALEKKAEEAEDDKDKDEAEDEDDSEEKLENVDPAKVEDTFKNDKALDKNKLNKEDLVEAEAEKEKVQGEGEGKKKEVNMNKVRLKNISY